MPESVQVVMPAHNEGRVVASMMRRVRETRVVGRSTFPPLSGAGH